MTSCEYIDKVEAGAKYTEKNEKVTIAGEVDRVYKKVQDKIILEVGDGSSIQIEKNNLKDTGKSESYNRRDIILIFFCLVVWNPWIEKAKGMGDFDDEEYKNMICVEAGSVADWVVLAGGQTWAAGQTLTVV